jgi:hypothetical protein
VIAAVTMRAPFAPGAVVGMLSADAGDDRCPWKFIPQRLTPWLARWPQRLEKTLLRPSKGQSKNDWSEFHAGTL